MSSVTDGIRVGRRWPLKKPAWVAALRLGRLRAGPAGVVPTREEVRGLLGADVSESVVDAAVDNVLLRFLLWRKWYLRALLPAVLGQSVLQVTTAVSNIQQTVALVAADSVAAGDDAVRAHLASYALYQYSGLLLAATFQAVAFVLAVVWAGRWRISRRWAVFSWSAPFAFTYLQYAIPLEKVLTQPEGLAVNGTAPQLTNGTVALLQNLWGAATLGGVLTATVLALAPASVPLLPSLIRGANLVRTMFPESPELDLIGHLATMLFIPVESAILLILVQVGGSWLLMAAIWLLVASIMTPAFATSRKYHVMATTGQRHRPGRCSSQFAKLFGLAGLVTLVVFLSADPKGLALVRSLAADSFFKFLLELVVSCVICYGALRWPGRLQTPPPPSSLDCIACSSRRCESPPAYTWHVRLLDAICRRRYFVLNVISCDQLILALCILHAQRAGDPDGTERLQRLMALASTGFKRGSNTPTAGNQGVATDPSAPAGSKRPSEEDNSPLPPWRLSSRPLISTV